MPVFPGFLEIIRVVNNKNNIFFIKIITKQFFYGILLLKLFFMKMHIINENLI